MGRDGLLGWQRRALDALTTPWVGLAVLGAVVLLLYLPSISNWGSVDDLTHLRAALNHEAPFRTFFRPLERFINEVNVSWLGYGDLRFSLLVNLAGLLLTFVVTYLLGLILYPGERLASLFAATLLALSSLSATPTLQIDAISQQFATVFALLFFSTLLLAMRRSSRGLFVLAFSFAALSLLSKETSLGIIAAIPLAVFLVTLRTPNRTVRQNLLAMLTNYVVLALVVLLYLGLRTALGYTFGGESSQYTLTLSPARLARNAVLYFAGLVYIGGSTLDLFPALKQGRVIVSGILSALLFSGSLLGTLRLAFKRVKEGIKLLALLLLTLAGSIPVIATGQVSELYVYSSLPYFALFIGLTFIWGCRQFATWLGRSRTFLTAVVFSCCLFAWILDGTSSKLEAYNNVSDQSWRYFTQARAFINDAPQRNISLCWAVHERVPSYSVFVRDPHLLASRALSFAADLHQHQDGTKRITVQTSAPNFSTCDYEMILSAQRLQFEPLG